MPLNQCSANTSVVGSCITCLSKEAGLCYFYLFFSVSGWASEDLVTELFISRVNVFGYFFFFFKPNRVLFNVSLIV